MHAVEVAFFGDDLSGLARWRRLEAEPLVVEYITRKEHAAVGAIRELVLRVKYAGLQGAMKMTSWVFSSQ